MEDLVKIIEERKRNQFLLTKINTSYFSDIYDLSLTSSFFSDIEKISEYFEVNTTSGIYTFLEQHKDFAPILLDCYNEINKRFGNTKPNISLIIDEENNTWKTIFIKIPYESNFENALDDLDNLLQNWMFLQSKEFRKFVTISII